MKPNIKFTKKALINNYQWNINKPHKTLINYTIKIQNSNKNSKF